MRIEDIDGPRVLPGAQEALLEDLRWLGIDWDGEVVVQSRRLPAYQAAVEALKAKGLLYPCTCTRKEIAGIASAPHGEDGPPYTGACRQGPSHPGRPEAWRFKMAAAAEDFVVQRADGVFAYQLACAVDDAFMGVTEVVRGEDLRSSAKRQSALLAALGAPVPTYWHVPLLLGPDGERLAKRNGAKAIASYRAEGLDAAAVRVLALQGL